MLIETFQSLAAASRQLSRNWRLTLILAGIYASLLASIYLFVTTREASLSQVALSFALAVSAPLLFFSLQAISANGANRLTSSSLLRKSLLDLWKLLLVSVPVILLGLVTFYLLSKAQTHLTGGITNSLRGPYDSASLVPTQAQAPGAKQPVQWGVAILTSVRYLTFGLALPLMLIQLWISTVQQGLWSAIRCLKEHVLRAYSPNSVLIYMCGFVVFGVGPYLLLFKTTATAHAWVEFPLFVGRLALVFGLTLFGWVITMQALSVSCERSGPVIADEES